MHESLNKRQLKIKIKQSSDKSSELKLHMRGKNQREMKTDQSILNWKKKAYILMLFRNREGKSKHKVCLLMRRGTTNEQKWNIVVKLAKEYLGQANRK